MATTADESLSDLSQEEITGELLWNQIKLNITLNKKTDVSLIKYTAQQNI